MLELDEDQHNYETSDNDSEELAEIVENLGATLKKLVDKQISIRQVVETRWLDALDQYNGRYDEATWDRIKKSGGSRVFINITRPKTLAAESRIADMLFPSDDKNWAIQPTPVPDSNLQPEMLEAIQQDATKRAELMSAEIDDQLIECNYHRKAREAIHDACLFGTGILKAPVIQEKISKKWSPMQGAVHNLQVEKSYVPSVEKIDVWNFFPDMAAHKLEDCEFILERRYISASQLRKMARLPAYAKFKDNIREILEQERQMDTADEGTHIARLQVASGLNTSLSTNRFCQWEYTGSLTTKELIACGCEMDDDPLMEHSAVVAFIDDKVIKAELNHDEMGESPYSMLIYERDDSSLFGLGVPDMMKNEQASANAAWRMTLDNANATVKPQIVFNRELVTPADGDYSKIYAGKQWLFNGDMGSVRDVFATYEINGHQQELVNIFELAKTMADDVTSLPLIAQGSQDAAPDTASGTSMLMNAANTSLRRIVKCFDDYVTEPLITRFYNWNMQNSEREDIKGDMTIDARGSSALLVKEQQNASLRQLLITAEQPSYAPLTKHAELYRKAIQAEHLNADDIVKTDEEIAADVQQPDPVQQQIQQLTLDKLKAEISKLNVNNEQSKAVTAVKNVEALFSAIQASKEFGGLSPEQVLALSKMADEIAKSAGIVDYNQFPIVGNPALQTMPVEQDVQNTHPQYPDNPQMGMMTGIDT